MKLIAIYNNKGGCGKSTSVINLAYEFSSYGKVLVIDTDGQSNTSRFFLKEPKGGLERVLLGERDTVTTEETEYEGIDLISATAAINNAIGTFCGFSEKEQCKIAEGIVKPNGDYEYVIVDLPPAMNVITEHIVGACDYVFVPIELGKFSIQGVANVTSVIAKCKAQFGGVYVNKFDKKNKTDIALLGLLSEQLGNKALNTLVPYSNVIKNSISYTETAREYMGWTSAGKAFKYLAEEIIERIGE